MMLILLLLSVVWFSNLSESVILLLIISLNDELTEQLHI